MPRSSKTEACDYYLHRSSLSMGDDPHPWQDPLLLTDVSYQERSSVDTFCSCPPDPLENDSTRSLSSFDSKMEAAGPLHHNVNEDDSPRTLNANNVDDGPSMFSSPLSPPDLRDVPRDSNCFLDNAYPKSMTNSVGFSVEEASIGSETKATSGTLAENLENGNERKFLEASLEHFPSKEDSRSDVPIICINAGSSEPAATSSGLKFCKDDFFTGGDPVMTDARVGGDDEYLPLYQTARCGNFSYHLSSLKPGYYLVDLHLAETVFTDGPSGMRVFDVYIQEKKVACSIDIYARVGANKLLIISDLGAFVDGDGGLLIQFEGLTGAPIVCGISVRRGFPESFGDEPVEFWAISQKPQCESPNGNSDSEVGDDIHKLQRDYDFHKKELAETKQALLKLRQDNELKDRECREAWKSLKDLQKELMRKSMHVGSLAFAVEGQVTEKSRWVSSLRNFERKLKILKMEQVSLSEEALAHKSLIAQMNGMNATIQFNMKKQADQYEDLRLKLMDGATERKDLYNKVLELKGNIRVFCRCRPLSAEEINAGATIAVDFELKKEGEIAVKSNGPNKKSFKFDAVFSPETEQVNVFEDAAPFATSVLDGYNVCIFAYGQTGTGKTFTMEGTEEARGVNFRTLEELFRIIKEREALVRYDVLVSVLEVYNEQIRDLLVSRFQPGVAAKRLEVRQAGERIHHVPGLVEAHVSNMGEVWEVLKAGSNARAVGSTNANEHSSRSHCIHCVMVKGENLVTGECTRSKLWLVDLAGSERIARTEVQGDRLKETQSINKSLSALGDVISALASKSPHIPFRNSKLTHLLQDSLGGDSKTLMFVQISPNESDLSETLCSLNFASRVRGVELGPAKKQMDSTELLKYKQLFEKGKQEVKCKDLQIKKMEDTIHCLEVKMKEKDLKNKSLQDKVKDLEGRLLTEKKAVFAQQQEEQDSTVRLPLGENNRGCKLAWPLHKTDAFVKYNDPTEKENNPEAGDQLPWPKRTKRATICPAPRHILAVPAPRRCSLIPSLGALDPVQLQMPPLQDNRGVEEDADGKGEATGSPEPTPTNSPSPTKGFVSSGKKLSSILRRSLHKKIYMKKPQIHPHGRKVGTNVGMEKVRVSIGSRGRMTHGNVKRGTDAQQKQSQKDKERGWNIGAAGKGAAP